ncbi:ABC transporter permease [Clostridium thermarum]|uniref:ABC transporter permease n=1 Tax=Clostridium thermarum TaxID=1716543 RepID=UPI0011241C59|nr:ABC transporter permease [Clostridium thermarum]
MRLAFKIAWRFLKSSKGQSILIALGIAIGVSVQVFIGSLIQGLQKSLVNKTIGSSSHITVLPEGEVKYISDYEKIEELIKQADNRIEKVSSAVDGFAFIKSGDNSYSVQVRGFDFEAADKIYSINSALVEGKLAEEENELVIGKELAKAGELKVGDSITLVTAAGEVKEFTISGIFDLKVAALNKSWTIMDRAAAQKLLGLEGKVTSIETQVAEDMVFDADEVALSIENALNNSNLKLENWKTQNEQLLSGLSGQSASSSMIQVFVLVSVVLGIASVLAISVVQKSKQIGILKAMGIKDKAASLIFIFQGLILGIAGSVMGVGLGLLLSVSFTKFALNADGTPVVPLFIDSKFIALSAVIALAAAVVAAVIPAGKSSRLNPMEVIKNG